MLALLIPGLGMGGGAAIIPVEVPDVVGETQAQGTSDLEGAGFVAAVVTAYSASVAAGTIISQDPIGGSLANPGSTVTITVSLGPEPPPDVEPVGGHYWPQKPKKPKDYRSEQDDRRIEEQRELREIIARAAGLIEEAEDIAPAAQVTELKRDLSQLSAQVSEPPDDAPVFDAAAMQARVDRVIAAATDELIVRITGLLTDLIQEISEDD